jgi:hypothetical protein
MKTIDRRLRRLEAVTAERRARGPSPAERLRERVRRYCIATGKELPEYSSKLPLRDDGNPLTIAERLRQPFRRTNPT